MAAESKPETTCARTGQRPLIPASSTSRGIKEQRGLLKLADERLRNVMSQRDAFREIALHGSPTQVIQAMEKECTVP